MESTPPVFFLNKRTALVAGSSAGIGLEYKWLFIEKSHARRRLWNKGVLGRVG